MQNRVEIRYINSPVVSQYQEEVPGAYKVEHKGGKIRRYIGRALFGWLMKVSSVLPYSRTVERVDVKRVEIDYTEIEKAIYDQVDNLRRLGEEPHMIILGHDQIKALEDRYMSMNLSFPSWYNPHTYYNEEPMYFMDIEMKYVPWVDGLIVVPKGNN